MLDGTFSKRLPFVCVSRGLGAFDDFRGQVGSKEGRRVRRWRRMDFRFLTRWTLTRLFRDGQLGSRWPREALPLRKQRSSSRSEGPVGTRYRLGEEFFSHQNNYRYIRIYIYTVYGYLGYLTRW